MKHLLPVLFMLITSAAFAQHVANTFQAVENTDISMQRLDAIYPSAVATDQSKAVFKADSQNGFIKAYAGMQQDLGAYLRKSGFSWKKPESIFTRVYFAPDGSINYYLVNLANTSLDDSEKRSFLNLVNKFIESYKISYTATTRFAQCSPVLFKNN